MLSDFAAEIYFDSLGCITFEVFVKAKVASGSQRLHLKCPCKFQIVKSTRKEREILSFATM